MAGFLFNNFDPKTDTLKIARVNGKLHIVSEDEIGIKDVYGDALESWDHAAIVFKWVSSHLNDPYRRSKDEA
jgi:hypothetical protein